MTIRDAQEEAWNCAEAKGFHTNPVRADRNETLLRLCLVHTEISEAAQEVKRHWNGTPTPEQKMLFALELADAVIRILDLSGEVGVDLEGAVVAKMVKNRARPFMYNTPMEVK